MSKLSQETKEIIFLFNEHKLLILKEIYDCKDDICGCDLVKKVGISKDLLSYHIKSLKGLEILEEIPCGRKKNYKISMKKYDLVQNVLQITRLIKEGAL